MERREFIKTTGLIGGAYALAGQASVARLRIANRNDYWLDGPMRWAQLAFVERDPGHYDPDFWLSYFKRIHADGALLSAGGRGGFLPDQHSAAPPERFSGQFRYAGLSGGRLQKTGHEDHAPDRSPCRPAGCIRRPSRLDCGNADGQKRRHWANPDLWVTCALGPYNFEFMPQVNTEIMERFQPEGIFSNRWAGHDICYCEHCTP